MRKLTIGTATMTHAILDGSTPIPETSAPRLEEAERLVQEGVRRGCDLLCLPELFADPSQGTQAERYAETLGGPVTTWLSERAKKLRMALATTVALKKGRRLTNTGVVYDKKGRLAGRYDKVHLPPGEREIAAPGNGFPVFEVEGVPTGMQTCYDLGFPEGCRILALKGARLVIWPNMWGGMPEAFTDVIMRARAMENKVCMVSTAYLLAGGPDFRAPKIHGRSCVIDPAGVIVAEVGNRIGVATATVEFDDSAKQTGPSSAPFEHRLPGTYRELTGRR